MKEGDMVEEEENEEEEIEERVDNTVEAKIRKHAKNNMIIIWIIIWLDYLNAVLAGTDNSIGAHISHNNSWQKSRY